jgi:hypothetical protein
MTGSTLKHFGFAPGHSENFGMAIGALEFMLLDVNLVAKGHRTRASVGVIYDIARRCLKLLSIGYADPEKE